MKSKYNTLQIEIDLINPNYYVYQLFKKMKYEYIDKYDFRMFWFLTSSILLIIFSTIYILLTWLLK